MDNVVTPDPGAYSGRSFGGQIPLPLFEKIFQFARIFQEKNPKKPPKFSRPYKKKIKTPPSNF